jgi:hypothetical protein
MAAGPPEFVGSPAGEEGDDRSRAATLENFMAFRLSMASGLLSRMVRIGWDLG